MHILGLTVFCLFFLMPFFSSPLMLSCYLAFSSLILAILLGAFGHMWYIYALGLVFTGGMMIMVLYVTNLASSGKSKFMDMMGFTVSAGLLFFLPCLGISNSALSQGQGMFDWTFSELLIFSLVFLLAGLFIIVALLDKKMGALR